MLTADGVGRCAAFQHGEEVVRRHLPHPLSCGCRGRSEVREDEGVLAGQEVRVDCGFVFVHVKPSARDGARLERGGEEIGRAHV